MWPPFIKQDQLGSRQEVYNYQTNFLTCICSKIMKRILVSSISKHFEQHHCCMVSARNSPVKHNWSEFLMICQEICRWLAKRRHSYWFFQRLWQSAAKPFLIETGYLRYQLLHTLMDFFTMQKAVCRCWMRKIVVCADIIRCLCAGTVAVLLHAS